MKPFIRALGIGLGISLAAYGVLLGVPVRLLLSSRNAPPVSRLVAHTPEQAKDTSAGLPLLLVGVGIVIASVWPRKEQTQQKIDADKAPTAPSSHLRRPDARRRSRRRRRR